MQEKGPAEQAKLAADNANDGSWAIYCDGRTTVLTVYCAGTGILHTRLTAMEGRLQLKTGGSRVTPNHMFKPVVRCRFTDHRI